MFNKSFFPTPQSLVDKMLEGVDWDIIGSILEPSAGKGDIIDGIERKHKLVDRWNYHPLDIDAIEIEPNLRAILKEKEIRVVCNDFLNFHTYKHYDLIIMNPPFDNGDKHLMKALEMQEVDGGKVVCILNAETLRNPYTNIRKVLVQKLTDLNAEVTFYTNAFKDAERKTYVDIALVKVNIPRKTKESDILKELKKAAPLQDNTPNDFAGIVVDDVIQAAVAQYNFEASLGIKLIDEYNSIKPLLGCTFNSDTPLISLSTGKHDANKNDFICNLRSKYWHALFENQSFTGLLTSNLVQKYQSNVNELRYYDFSLYNIFAIRYEMSKDMCKGVEDTIINLFDEFSHKYSYIGETSRNIHYYNGWKTNDAFKINKKVIVPIRGWRDMDYSFGGFHPTSYDVINHLSDIEKAFNYLDDGTTPDVSLRVILQIAENTVQSKNIHCKYFDLTFYKKGTCHITFTNEKLLDKFNIFGSQHKGWLPPSYGKKTYKNMSKEEQQVVDEFQGKDSYEEVCRNKDYYLFDSSKILMLEGN